MAKKLAKKKKHALFLHLKIKFSSILLAPLFLPVSIPPLFLIGFPLIV